MNSEADALMLLTGLCNKAHNFQSQKDQSQALHRVYHINQGCVNRWTDMRIACQSSHIGGNFPIYTALMDANFKANGLDGASATMM